MFWLCWLFGHKHFAGFENVRYEPDFCLRCHRPSPDEASVGDPTLPCLIFGHQTRKTIVGDFLSLSYGAKFCFRCHHTAGM